MTRSEKLFKRLRSIPVDFTWDEMSTVLCGFGFRDMSDLPGSSRTYVHANGNKIKLHKPHPTNIMKRYVLRQVIAQLDALGLQGELNE